jgi:hypothetical protein
MMTSLSSEFSVPGNSSRFFKSKSLAVAQPLGNVHLIWDEINGIVTNKKFNPSLINYDDQYCTSISPYDGHYVSPTLSHIDKVLEYLKPNPRVIEIGCGKGDFIVALRNRGLNAMGFDPVLPFSNSYLKSKYWDVNDPVGDLFVMRCVLPHISDPWEFLSRISSQSPGALVLIEFQRLEWILENLIWYQVSHDHVNIFSLLDFEKRFNVIASGVFSNEEWGWILIDPKRIANFCNTIPKGYTEKFDALFFEKKRFIEKSKNLHAPFAIWGAAGKGIVLANAIAEADSRIFAIDMDPIRWDLFLEASGVQVISPNEARIQIPKGSQIFVCNPNHVSLVMELVGEDYGVSIPREL